MSNFVAIGSGKPFVGELPKFVILPESVIEGDLVVTTNRIVSIGDSDWEEALFRWMFLNGYCLKEDNEREMK